SRVRPLARRSSKLLLRRSPGEADLGDARRDVQADLSLDRQWLEREPPSRAADEDIGAEPNAGRRLRACSSIGAREGAGLDAARGGDHAPDQMPLLDSSQRDAVFGDLADIGNPRTAIIRNEYAGEGLLLYEDESHTRGNVAGKRADPHLRLR